VSTKCPDIGINELLFLAFLNIYYSYCNTGVYYHTKVSQVIDWIFKIP